MAGDQLTCHFSLSPPIQTQCGRRVWVTSNCAAGERGYAGIRPSQDSARAGRRVGGASSRDHLTERPLHTAPAHLPRPSAPSPTTRLPTHLPRYPPTRDFSLAVALGGSPATPEHTLLHQIKPRGTCACVQKFSDNFCKPVSVAAIYLCLVFCCQSAELTCNKPTCINWQTLHAGGRIAPFWFLCSIFEGDRRWVKEGCI